MYISNSPNNSLVVAAAKKAPPPIAADVPATPGVKQSPSSPALVLSTRRKKKAATVQKPTTLLLRRSRSADSAMRTINSRSLTKEQFLANIKSQYDALHALNNRYALRMDSSESHDVGILIGVLAKLQLDTKALESGADAQAVYAELKEWQFSVNGLRAKETASKYRQIAKEDDAKFAQAAKPSPKEQLRAEKLTHMRALQTLNKDRIDHIVDRVRAARRRPGQENYNAGSNPNLHTNGGGANPLKLQCADQQFEFTLRQVCPYVIENSDSAYLKVRTLDGIFIHLR